MPKILAGLKADPRRWYRENKLGDAAIAGDAVRPPHPESSAELDEVQRVAKDQQMMREHDAMMLAEHRRTMWCHLVNIGLGAWLVTSPFAFGLFDAAVTFDAAILNVTAERALSPPEWRAALHGRSDIVSGLLIALFGMLSLRRRTKWAQWAATLVGLWLLFAPLLFWSPQRRGLQQRPHDGMLVIALAVLVPMMPGMSMEGMMDSTSVPRGWTYSPSSWMQRLPIIAMGVIGLLIAWQLTVYQLGQSHQVWDPFFPWQGGLNGTETVITSDVSKAWPIPDAGLGAVAYA